MISFNVVIVPMEKAINPILIEITAKICLQRKVPQSSFFRLIKSAIGQNTKPTKDPATAPKSDVMRSKYGITAAKKTVRQK